MPKKYAFDVLKGRLATWKPGYALFTKEEIERWQQEGIDAILLQQASGKKAYVLQMDDLVKLNDTYFAIDMHGELLVMDMDSFSFGATERELNKRTATHVQQAITNRELQ